MVIGIVVVAVYATNVLLGATHWLRERNQYVNSWGLVGWFLATGWAAVALF